MAITKISNDLIDLNQSGDFSGLRLPEGTTADREESFTTDYLVVGGGGGTSNDSPGGGGAGGLRTSYGSTSGGGGSAESDLTLVAGTSYTVTVGTGGTSNTAGNSSVFSTITSDGGGRGSGGGTSYVAGNGASGGGGSGGSYGNAGGSGTSNQGFAGGTSGANTGGTGYPGGGGGGAAALGQSLAGSGDNGGTGGAGLAVNILNAANAATASVGEVDSSNVYYAGGGGGSTYTTTQGSGGLGGGGDGQKYITGTATNNGTANTGGGAGGLNATGGSGVVILRYPTASATGFTITGTLNTPSAGSQTQFTEGSDTIIVFTGGTGTVTFTGSSPAPPAGSIRYNTTTKTVEFYNGSWVEAASTKFCTTNTLNFPAGTTGNAVYTLDSTVSSVGGTYTGTNNNVTFDSSGKYGASAVFNGTNAYVASGFTAPTSTTASISVWVKIAAYTSYGGFVGDSTGTGVEARFFLGQGNGTSGNLWVSVANGTSSWNDETTVSLTSYGLGTWFHLVGTVDGTAVKIYINGSLIQSFTSTVSYTGNGQHNYYFGGWGPALFLNGELDQIRFFADALTLSQVQDLYNNETEC